MTLFVLLVTPFLEYVINTGLNYSLKSELVFQIYVTIGLITILTVIAHFANVHVYFGALIYFRELYADDMTKY